jgi:hypothetical protein
MSLKINPSLSIELAEDVGNNIFLLHGHKNLDGIIPYFEDMHEGLFSKHYEDGDDILYHATLICEGRNHLQEVGLGIFKIDDDRSYIERVRPFFYIDEDNEMTTGDDLLNFFSDLKASDTVIISSYIPQSIQEVLCHPNTIISCHQPHIMHPVTLNKFSLLGRLDDDIDSLDISSIFTPHNVLSVLTKWTKMLKMMCSIFDVKKLRTPQIDFKPSKSPSTKKEGSVYYDKQDKVLKYYNGTEWVTLS